MATYETFAKIYDEVMDDSLYLDWLEFTRRHVNPTAKNVLELACGTGILSVELANLGIQVTGLDLSEDMIKIANKRIDPTDDVVSFKTGDMLALTDEDAYDVVTCYSDSICYMPDEQSVKQVFEGVYRALTSSGTFIFDVHSLYQMNEHFSEYSYHYQTDDFAFLWESYPGDYEHSVEHFLTFFIQESDGLFKRYDELHEERTYDIETYQALLKDVGFSDVKVYADFEDSQPTDESARWFFVCEK